MPRFDAQNIKSRLRGVTTLRQPEPEQTARALRDIAKSITEIADELERMKRASERAGSR